MKKIFFLKHYKNEGLLMKAAEPRLALKINHASLGVFI
jgi:hypothetical protein